MRQNQIDMELARNAAPPPSPVREAPGNQSWKSNFLAVAVSHD
jgi:hypothetical protein